MRREGNSGSSVKLAVGARGRKKGGLNPNQKNRQIGTKVLLHLALFLGAENADIFLEMRNFYGRNRAILRAKFFLSHGLNRQTQTDRIGNYALN